MIEEKIDAVLFELNWKRRALRNFLLDLDFAHADFEAAGRALLAADLSRDDDAGFLRQPLQRFERFRVLLERADPLNDSRAIAKNRKQQFPRLTQVIQPPLQGDFLPVILSSLFDGDRRHREVLCPNAKRQVYQRAVLSTNLSGRRQRRPKQHLRIGLPLASGTNRP